MKIKDRMINQIFVLVSVNEIQDCFLKESESTVNVSPSHSQTVYGGRQ